VWLYLLIIVGGTLQAWGPQMNGSLRSAHSNLWLARLVSFLPIVAFLGVLAICMS
jgi:transporter family-2 protein